MHFVTKGTTDDVTACDRCGRADLKATVIIVVADADGNATGDVRHFGRICAAKHAGRPAAAIAKEARAADAAAARDRRKAAEAANASFHAFVDAASDAPTHFERIRELGGINAANAAYKAAQATA